MGPEDKGCYALYMDGVRLELAEPPAGLIKPGITYEVTVSADALTPGAKSLFLPGELTMTVKTPKHWRCRSRKRFIKLVMSKGISRNGAVWLANWVRNAGYTYAQAWWPWCWYL